MTHDLCAADERFLGVTRLGILISTRRDGTPLGVPVWFEWDGRAVSMFSAADSPKTARLRRDPFASVLVTNRVGEPEHWVAFDGEVSVGAGGLALAERLAAAYWDLGDPASAATLATWRQHPDALVLLTLKPSRIRSGR